MKKAIRQLKVNDIILAPKISDILEGYHPTLTLRIISKRLSRNREFICLIFNNGWAWDVGQNSWDNEVIIQ